MLQATKEKNYQEFLFDATQVDSTIGRPCDTTRTTVSTAHGDRETNSGTNKQAQGSRSAARGTAMPASLTKGMLRRESNLCCDQS